MNYKQGIQREVSADVEKDSQQYSKKQPVHQNANNMTGG